MLSGNFFKIIIQSILFLLLAKYLGVNEFGLFSICIALAGLFAAFDAIGVGSVLLKDISRSRRVFELRVATVIFVYFVTSIFLILAYILVFSLLFDNISLLAIFNFAVSELFFQSFIYLKNQIYQGLNKFNFIVYNNVGLSLMRLLGVFFVGWLCNYNLNLEQVSSVFVIASGLWFLISSISFVRIIELRWNIRLNLAFLMLKQGIHFSLSKLSAIGNSESDKVMLGQLKGEFEAGIYSVSVRLINMIMVPVNTVFSVTMPKYFLHGKNGILSNYNFSTTFVPYLLLYASLCFLLLMNFSNYIPIILGESYAYVENSLKYLALVPVIKIISTAMADSLTGAGYQAKRSKIQIAALFVNIITNIILIKKLSWLGAIFSLYISELFLIISYAILTKKLK